MARSDYDFINLSLEHELNEWLAEKGYAGQAGNRNRLAEVVTRKLQDSFYIYQRFLGCAEHGIQ